MKFNERFVKTIERFTKFTEQFMKFPIEFIFLRERSVVHSKMFGILTKPFEGCSGICHLHLSFERYNEPFDKVRKPFERFVEQKWPCILQLLHMQFYFSNLILFQQTDNKRSVQFKTCKHARRYLFSPLYFCGGFETKSRRVPKHKNLSSKIRFFCCKRSKKIT